MMSGRDVRTVFMIPRINILQNYLTQDLRVLSRVDFVRFRLICRGAGISIVWTLIARFPPLALIPICTHVIPTYTHVVASRARSQPMTHVPTSFPHVPTS